MGGSRRRGRFYAPQARGIAATALGDWTAAMAQAAAEAAKT